MTTTEQSKSTMFLLDGGGLTLPLATSELGAQYLTPGTVVDDKYRVVSLLGTGGMGAVYKVCHLLLGNEVALKTFQNMRLSDEQLLRFVREAKALARLTHKHLVRVFDYGSHNGVPYYTMEYLQGESLADRLNRSVVLDPEPVAQIFGEVAQALQYIHSKNIVHRDLKPGNIFLQRRSNNSENDIIVKLVDFGIASFTAAEEDQRLTQFGSVFGSPLYMSPEQGQGLTVNAASDNYSFGCSLFQALTGEPPFYAETALATIMMHQTEAPPMLGTTGGVVYPARLEALVAKLLAKDYRKRMADLNIVQEELLAAAAWSKASPPASGQSIPAWRAVLPTISLVNSQTSGHIDASEEAEDITDRLPAKYILGAILVLALILLVPIYQSWTGFIAKSHAATQSPADKIVPALAANHFEGIISSKHEDGTTTIDANFPANGSAGEMSFDGKNYIAASGRKSWSTTQTFYFKPGPNFLSKPENIDQFAEANIVGLDLSAVPPGEKSEKLLKHLVQLRTLSTLNLGQSFYDERSIFWLKQLSALQNLTVSDSRLTGMDMAKLPYLHNLRVLDFSNRKNALALSQALKGSQNLKHLLLNHTVIESGEMACIATLPNLESLAINDTGATDADMEPLTALDHLKMLEATNSAVTDNCYLTMMLLNKKGLKSLTLSSVPISLLMCQRLLQVYPDDKINKSDRGLMQNFATEFEKGQELREKNLR